MQPLHWIAWNILLAAIPAAAAYILAAGIRNYRPAGFAWLLWTPLALAWFVFLPNTCYLLTEWRHFLFDPYFTTWRMNTDNSSIARLIVARQGLFFLVYSGIGVLCYTLSIRPVERILRECGAKPVLLAPFFFFLTSMGVYMGLIRRLNSWDVVTHPEIVWNTALHAFTNPLLIQVICVFAILLWFLYEIVDIWVDGLMQRLSRNSAASAPVKPKRKARG